MTETEQLRTEIADLKDRLAVLESRPIVAHTLPIGLHLDEKATKAQREKAARELEARG